MLDTPFCPSLFNLAHAHFWPFFTFYSPKICMFDIPEEVKNCIAYHSIFGVQFFTPCYFISRMMLCCSRLLALVNLLSYIICKYSCTDLHNIGSNCPMSEYILQFTVALKKLAFLFFSQKMFIRLNLHFFHVN